MDYLVLEMGATTAETMGASGSFGFFCYFACAAITTVDVAVAVATAADLGSGS